MLLCFSVIVAFSEFLEEVARHLEAALSHAVPEIEVLRGVGVLEWYVADDAERDERRLIDKARLGDSTALHVHGGGIGEVLHDGLHLLALVDKPVTTDGDSLDDFRSLRHLDAQGRLYEIFRSLEAGGHTHDLAIGDVVAAVDIMPHCCMMISV